MMKKKWYHSRMLWTNAGAVIASVGAYFETENLAVVFPVFLALVNIVLRLVTKTEVEL